MTPRKSRLGRSLTLPEAAAVNPAEFSVNKKAASTGGDGPK
jgi:hypothetical protein